MMFSPFDLVLAWLLDAAIGDPPWLPWPHPVVWMGRAIRQLEARLTPPGAPQKTLFLRGLLLWCCMVLGTLLLGSIALRLAALVHPWLGHLVATYIAYACLATRELSGEAGAIGSALAAEDLEHARRRLSRIVGRDTDHLPAPEVARATVETVAENTSDGVVAPLFYLAVGASLGLGPLLGLAYKAVNTMDSMLGYRTERHEWFGKAAARLDDAANWVPARLSAALTCGAAQLLWRNGRIAWRITWRDGKAHKSPNAGYPEAAFAGALGVQLGGDSSYAGVTRQAPLLGDPGPALDATHIGRATTLLWWTSAAALAAALLLMLAA